MYISVLTVDTLSFGKSKIPNNLPDSPPGNLACGFRYRRDFLMGRGEELASSEFMSVKRAASHISAKRKFMRKRRNEVTSKRLYCEAIQEEAQDE